MFLSNIGGKAVATIPKASLLPERGKKGDKIKILGNDFGTNNKVLFVNNNGAAFDCTVKRFLTHCYQ